MASTFVSVYFYYSFIHRIYGACAVNGLDGGLFHGLQPYPRGSQQRPSLPVFLLGVTYWLLLSSPGFCYRRVYVYSLLQAGLGSIRLCLESGGDSL